MTTETLRLTGRQLDAVKHPVITATTANITLSGEQTIDDIAVTEGDRVLVKDQTAGSEDGIYEVSTGSWSRTSDWNESEDLLNGMLVPCVSGTANANTVFMITFSGTFTLDTTAPTATAI